MTRLREAMRITNGIGVARFGMAGSAWRFMECRGLAGRGTSGLGQEWHGL